MKRPILMAPMHASQSADGSLGLHKDTWKRLDARDARDARAIQLFVQLLIHMEADNTVPLDLQQLHDWHPEPWKKKKHPIEKAEAWLLDQQWMTRRPEGGYVVSSEVLWHQPPDQFD